MADGTQNQKLFMNNKTRNSRSVSSLFHICDKVDNDQDVNGFISSYLLPAEPNYQLKWSESVVDGCSAEEQS